MINLIAVEDHPFTRQTLVYSLKKMEGINLVASYENGQQAVEYIKKNTCDVILMDVDMPIMDGIEATHQIKQFNPDIKIIMLTAHDDKNSVLKSFSSGANGFCVKKINTKELLEVINIIYNGGIWFDKSIACFIIDIMKSTSAQETQEEPQKKKTLEDYNISARERNVLKLISDGYTNSQIAEELVISLNTVKNHVASIINKMAVKDRTQIAVEVLKNDLLS